MWERFDREMSEKNISQEVTTLGEEQKEAIGGNGGDPDDAGKVHPDDGASALNHYKETCIFCRIAIGKEGDKNQGVTDIQTQFVIRYFLF